MNLSRRNFGLMGGVALSALASVGVASANTAFTAFAFPATGGITSRTEPDRWADQHNVLDFGADPTGISDSTSAIQAAVNWTANAQRGTIYFPPGFYTVTGSISLYFGSGTNQSIVLRGDGASSIISGTVAGYILDRYDPAWDNPSGVIVIEKLLIQNGSTTEATGAIRLGNCNGAVVRDCSIGGMNGVVLNQAEDNSTFLSNNTLISNCTFPAPGTRLTNSNAVVTGNGTTIINMDASNWDCAIRVCGSGNSIVSGRFEENNYGHIYGVDQFGNAVPAQGCAAGGFSMESNRITFIDFINASECYLYETGGGSFNGSSYGLRLRSGVSNIVLVSCNFSGGYDVAAISIEDSTGTPGRGNTFIGCTATNLLGTVWTMPTKALTAKFINSTNPVPIFTFANLPGSSDRVFGDEYIISDSDVAVSAANFSATVAGSGAITANVRWNESNWVIC